MLKEQILNVLKGVMDHDKALLEEVSYENNVLKEYLEEKNRN